MNKKYDYGIIIGRFQGFHLNHKAIVDTVLEQANKVIILLGSANRPVDFNNPFTVMQRMRMMQSVYAGNRNILVSSLDDYYDNHKWIMATQSTVDRIIAQEGNDPDSVSICISGNKTDKTSFYIDYFPAWEYIMPTNFNEEIKHIHASDVRDIMYANTDRTEELTGVVPDSIKVYLSTFRDTNEWKLVKEEYDCIKKDKAKWAGSPYAVLFTTVDAIVTCGDKVLLIKRKSAPGKGLWAMPGGFLEEYEYIEDGMLRELNEETKLNVPVDILRKSIKKVKVYDNPRRSTRGRVITHAYWIDLPVTYNSICPRIKASDDAVEAEWKDKRVLKPNNMFDDHYFVITDMLGT